MKPEQKYLLTKLAEEAAELSKEALKTLQFGFEGEYDNQTNLERLIKELHDVNAVRELLKESGIKIPDTEKEHVESKRSKMLKFAEYAKQTAPTLMSNETIDFLARKTQTYKVKCWTDPHNLDVLGHQCAKNAVLEFHRMLTGSDVAANDFERTGRYDGSCFSIYVEGKCMVLEYTPNRQNNDSFEGLYNMILSFIFSKSPLNIRKPIQEYQKDIEESNPICFDNLGFYLQFGEQNV